MAHQGGWNAAVILLHPPCGQTGHKKVLKRRGQGVGLPGRARESGQQADEQGWAYAEPAASQEGRQQREERQPGPSGLDRQARRRQDVGGEADDEELGQQHAGQP
jgi:hypothetical protein